MEEINFCGVCSNVTLLILLSSRVVEYEDSFLGEEMALDEDHPLYCDLSINFFSRSCDVHL